MKYTNKYEKINFETENSTMESMICGEKRHHSLFGQQKFASYTGELFDP